MREVEALAAGGTTEVTLLGQTVNSYHDGAARLRRPASRRRRGRRVSAGCGSRARTPPTSPPRVIEAMATTPAVCEHVHLPVQSGSDAVLRRMLRRYTRARYLEVVASAPVGHSRHHPLDRHHRRLPRRDRGAVRGDAHPRHRCRFRRRLYLQVLGPRGHAGRAPARPRAGRRGVGPARAAHRGGPRATPAGRTSARVGETARGAGRAPRAPRRPHARAAPAPTSSSCSTSRRPRPASTIPAGSPAPPAPPSPARSSRPHWRSCDPQPGRGARPGLVRFAAAALSGVLRLRRLPGRMPWCTRSIGFRRGTSSSLSRAR